MISIFASKFQKKTNETLLILQTIICFWCLKKKLISRIFLPDYDNLWFENMINVLTKAQNWIKLKNLSHVQYFCGSLRAKTLHHSASKSTYCVLIKYNLADSKQKPQVKKSYKNTPKIASPVVFLLLYWCRCLSSTCVYINPCVVAGFSVCCCFSGETRGGFKPVISSCLYFK